MKGGPVAGRTIVVDGAAIGAPVMVLAAGHLRKGARAGMAYLSRDVLAPISLNF
jgi:hypothetical protein